jgi:hypothetical protein
MKTTDLTRPFAIVAGALSGIGLERGRRWLAGPGTAQHC